MALAKKVNSTSKDINFTGFGTNSANSGGRFYNKDGTPNVEVTGLGLLESISVYNAMLKLPRWQFLGIIFTFYVVVNIVFAFIYVLVGIEQLGGLEKQTLIGKFWEAFFFSAQTLSTVGYGHVYPTDMMANSVAAFESLLGLLSFALATGMMYGRFARPRAYIKYSKNALFGPYKDGVAVMFRMVPFKHKVLTDAEVKVTVGLKVFENGAAINKFYRLALEIPALNSFTLSWTIVHHITEESPLYNLSKEDLLNANAELMVNVRAYDEAFSSTVISRTSYEASEYIFGARFKLMYHPNTDKTTTRLDISLLDQYDEAALSGISGLGY